MILSFKCRSSTLLLTWRAIIGLRDFPARSLYLSPRIIRQLVFLSSFFAILICFVLPVGDSIRSRTSLLSPFA